jgi:hypothetical protein
LRDGYGVECAVRMEGESDNGKISILTARYREIEVSLMDIVVMSLKTSGKVHSLSFRKLTSPAIRLSDTSRDETQMPSISRSTKPPINNGSTFTSSSSPRIRTSRTKQILQVGGTLLKLAAKARDCWRSGGTVDASSGVVQQRAIRRSKIVNKTLNGTGRLSFLIPLDLCPSFHQAISSFYFSHDRCIPVGSSFAAFHLRFASHGRILACSQRRQRSRTKIKLLGISPVSL